MLNEAVVAIRNLAEKAEDDPGRLERINERLYEIFRLKKKYGGSVEAVSGYAEESQKELQSIKTKIGDTPSLKREFDETRSAMSGKAIEVSNFRERAKMALERIVMDRLSMMGMPGARFVAEIKTIEDNTGLYEVDGKSLKGDMTGFESVEFQFCANPGEGLKPLARIASGGEISRVMLALKNAFIQKQSGGCEVFDEIDAGISGETASKIAAQLKELSKKHQVICITHLHQIASAADHHYRVFKDKAGRRSVTMVRKLNHEERVKEIASLLSGRKITAKALAGARELLEDTASGG